MTEATPEPIEPVEEVMNDVAEPAEETSAAAETEPVPEPVAEGETEAVNAPVEEPSVSAEEVPAEAEQGAEHQDAAMPEVTHDAVNGHSDVVEAATTESASVAEEPLEESQAVEPVAEVPAEPAAPVPAAAAEASGLPAEDDWASLPKKGKKNKKDKKKKQTAVTEPVSETVEAAPLQDVPTVDSEAQQPVEEPTGTFRLYTVASRSG